MSEASSYRETGGDGKTAQVRATRRDWADIIWERVSIDSDEAVEHAPQTRALCAREACMSTRERGAGHGRKSTIISPVHLTKYTDGTQHIGLTTWAGHLSQGNLDQRNGDGEGVNSS